jgi:tetratricopeptide (TPR) repeat protein
MPDPMICPSCGQANAADAAHCTRCNYPLGEPAIAPARAAAPTRSPAAPTEPFLRRPARRARPQPAMNSQSLTLWLLFGVFGAGVLIFTAIKANIDRSRPPVEGSNPEQQRHIDELKAVVERDSNQVQARVALGNLYYDTANWPEAIVEYRAAIRRDSSLVHALVDLGVCYYNLGNSVEAERHFLLGLQQDPHQPIALFNLGIVNERRADYDAAIEYFHRALADQPSEDIREGVMAAMRRIQEKTGRAPKPLPPGSEPPAGRPGGS